MLFPHQFFRTALGDEVASQAPAMISRSKWRLRYPAAVAAIRAEIIFDRYHLLKTIR